MEKFNELGSTVHGEIEYEGKALRLTQDAYLDSDFSNGYERPIYTARAIDAEGNEYEIDWEPVEGWEEFDDESNCCDWDKPESVTKIG